MTRILSIKTEPRIADYSRSYRHIDVDNDVTLDDLLTPGFWAHHAAALQAKDLLDVLSYDMELDVQLRVIESGVGFVMMRLCAERHKRGKAVEPTVETEEDTAPLPDLPRNYKVGFSPGSKRWYVQTTLTKPAQTVSTDHLTKREAIEEAIAHAAKVNTRIAA